jgi:ABC-2 type transport system permease protein
LPISLLEAVIGKFLAAWCFTAIALVLTFPVWVTINYLGEPDNTVIAAGYLGSLLLAGACLSIGSCISALTKNQVVAFVISFVICFAFNLSGFPIVLDMFSAWAPQAIVDVISSFSFLSHFESILRGVIDIRDIIFFASLIAFWLYATILAIEAKKGS